MLTPSKQSKLSKLKKIVLLNVLMLLTSCARTTFSNVCPSLRIYTAEQQDRMYVALSNLGADNPLRGAMDDYANLRQQVKACENAR